MVGGSAGLGRSLGRWLGLVALPALRKPLGWQIPANSTLVSSDEVVRQAMAAAHYEVWRLPVTHGQADISAVINGVVVEDRPRVAQAFGAACSGKDTLDIQYRRLEACGLIKWRHDVGTLVRGEHGDVQLLAVISQDVTSVREHEASLIGARDEAIASNHAKSEFLAYMSHEIRTPLSAILGFSEILDDPGQTPEHRAESVRIIRRNGELLSQIVNNVLDLSKIEAGRLEVERMRFPVRDAINDVCSTFLPAARAKNIGFDWVFDPSVPERMIGDPMRLKQVLINIIGNAVKFTPAGHVRLAVRGVRESGGDRQLEVLISDTGIGFSVEQRARLFQTYSQAECGTARKYGGSGLGLMLSRRLARMMGGDVDLLESSQGGGSTFRVRIRAEEEAAPVAVAAPAAPAPSAQTQVHA
jgi:signal transduction histidine kinase